MATPQPKANHALAIRRAGVHDIPALVRLRRKMFEEMGFHDAAELEALESACDRHFHETIRTGRFRAWVAVTDEDTVVACGGLVIDRHLPSPDNLCGRTGFLLSVFTEPGFRRQGLANRIVRTMLSELRESAVPAAALHASEAGRPLYVALGFHDSNEMRLSVEAVGSRFGPDW